MVIGNLNIERAGFCPFEADAILVIYTDAVLSLAISQKRLQAIARWYAARVGAQERADYQAKSSQSKQIPSFQIPVISVREITHGIVNMLAATAPWCLQPLAVRLTSVPRNIAAWDHVICGPLRDLAKRNEHIEVSGGNKVLALFIQNPNLPSHLAGLALNRDGTRCLRVGGENVNAPSVSQRDGRNVTSAGQLSGDKIFAGYSGKR